jgi:AraC family transcriptional regulator
VASRARNPATPASIIERINAQTGAETPLVLHEVLIFSDSLWKGVRLRQVRMDPAEVPEGQLTWPVVSVYTGRIAFPEMWFAGKKQSARRIAPGQVNVIPTGLPYSCRWSVPTEDIVLEFDPAFVEAVAGRDVDKDRLEIEPAFAAPDAILANLALLMAAEVRAEGRHGETYGEALGSAVVARLLRRHGAVRREAGRRPYPLSRAEMARIREYIDGHLEARLSLRELADLVGMNVYRFLRSFKASMGVPPHHYVLEQRLDRSKSLLADVGLPIAEVALRCGFANQSHFSTTFRRHVEVTPWRYRRALR